MKHTTSTEDLFESVRQWADDRKLIANGNPYMQMLKVLEEVGETAHALVREKTAETEDGIGDSFVTLIILAHQLNLDPMQCLQKAYDEIKDRKGYLNEEGIFIKDEEQ